MSSISQISQGSTRARLVLHVGILAGLVCLLYAPVIKALMERWWGDPNYGHGLLVPPFALFLLWRTRYWTRTASEPSNWGLLVMLVAVFLLIAGSFAAELFVSEFSLVLLICGIVVYFGGWKRLKALAFPLAFLLFMIPLPAIIYYQITFPLQLLASQLGAWTLQVFHTPVLREGNLLILPNATLDVVEACSGIRSLMTLMTSVVAYAYLFERRLWVRSMLIMLVVPIAIASNSLRISISGILTYTLGSSAVEGFYHLFEGLLMFVAALVLLFLTHVMLRLMDRYVGEVRNA